MATSIAEMPCAFSWGEGIERAEHFDRFLSADVRMMVSMHEREKFDDCEDRGSLTVLAAFIHESFEPMDLLIDRQRKTLEEPMRSPLYVAFVIRTDVMRMSLSVAKSEVAALGVNPQFRGVAQSEKHVFPMDDVEQASKEVMRLRTSTLDRMRNVLNEKELFPCEHVRVFFYEEYELNPYEFTDRVFSWLTRGKLSEAETRLFPRAKDVVNLTQLRFQKVHSDDIAEFVENAFEVQQFFLFQNLKSVGTMIAEQNLPCRNSELSL